MSDNDPRAALYRYGVLTSRRDKDARLSELMPVGGVVSPRNARPHVGVVVEVGSPTSLGTFREWVAAGEQPATVSPRRALVRWETGPLAGQTTWHEMKDLVVPGPKMVRRAYGERAPSAQAVDDLFAAMFDEDA